MGNHKADTAERTSSARIKSSADMLAVLRKCHAYLTQEDDCDDMAEVIEAIEDVIAQAEGK